MSIRSYDKNEYVVRFHNMDDAECKCFYFFHPENHVNYILSQFIETNHSAVVTDVHELGLSQNQFKSEVLNNKYVFKELEQEVNLTEYIQHNLSLITLRPLELRTFLLKNLSLIEGRFNVPPVPADNKTLSNDTETNDHHDEEKGSEDSNNDNSTQIGDTNTTNNTLNDTAPPTNDTAPPTNDTAPTTNDTSTNSSSSNNTSDNASNSTQPNATANNTPEGNKTAGNQNETNGTNNATKNSSQLEDLEKKNSTKNIDQILDEYMEAAPDLIIILTVLVVVLLVLLVVALSLVYKIKKGKVVLQKYEEMHNEVNPIEIKDESFDHGGHEPEDG